MSSTPKKPVKTDEDTFELITKEKRKPNHRRYFDEDTYLAQIDPEDELSDFGDRDDNDPRDW